ncbi:MAG: ROK family protein [Candidatus Omnitrophica bacterium]|nr:ROK family protein [Candidatus Omnitrophota bacterium]
MKTRRANQAVLGIDLGGTFIKAGLVTEDGQIVVKGQWPTLAEQKRREVVLSQMKTAVNHLLEQKPGLKLLGIGIGTPGLVDNQGKVYEAPNLPGWDNLPLRQIFEKTYHVPVVVENDVNSITWGEYLFGAGRGSRTMICITLGTGLGGGVVVKGQLLRGAVFSAAELGHVTIDYRGPVCNCGNIGCIEKLVSRDAIIERAVKAIQSGRTTSLVQLSGGDISQITPKMISQAAHQGDELSLEIWEEVGRCLGFFFVGMVNIFNPDRVVIGGGIAKAGNLLFQPIRTIVKRHAMKKLSAKLKIVRSGLKDNTGIISAAALIFQSRISLSKYHQTS